MASQDTTLEWARHLDRAVDEQFGDMVSIRRHLHTYPEPSGSEVKTTAFLEEQLRRAGLTPRLGPEGRGLLVDDGAADGERRVALRGDIDALRIQDAKRLPYRSQVPGVMHACGHDGHAATVVGAMLALRASHEAGALPWPCRWRGILQPAEETSRGAREMIAAGALEGVDSILSLHMDPSRKTGRIGLRTGALTASCDELEVRIEGRGGHAARPHESLDPIAAAAQLVSSIYLFVPRATDSHDPVVVTIGQIGGGDNPNVIPEHVLLRGTIRTLGEAVRGRTKDHIRQLARGLAEASGTQIHVAFLPGPQSVFNDGSLIKLLQQAGEDLLGADQIDLIPRPSMGGEDFAFYLDEVPGAMFRLGCSALGQSAPLHSPLFDIDEQAMNIGAKILARAAVLAAAPKRSKAKTEKTETESAQTWKS